MSGFFVDPRDVAPILRATFPDYTGKKVAIEARETMTLHSVNWSGGTRSSWAACTLDGSPTGNGGPLAMAPPWENARRGVENTPFPIPQGHALVEHCLFCGKDLGIRIYVNPADMPRYLPARADGELDETERKVLAIIRCLISRARPDEARRQGITGTAYADAVARLKAKGLLTAQGGLSLAGKNAAANLPRC